MHLFRSWLPLLACPLLTVGLVLSGERPGRAQDTIQSGTLRPLETLPSLGGPPGAPVVIPDFGTPSGLPAVGTPAPGMPPAGTPGLPTIGSPGQAGGSMLPPGGLSGFPDLSAPTLPGSAIPTPAAAPAVSPPAVEQTPAAPPPLPTGGGQVITEPLLQGYVYVEPYQTRVEVLFDAATMARWLFPGDAPPEELSSDYQQQVTAKAAERAAAWCSLSCNGEPLPAPQVQTAIIKGLPGNTLPLKEGESLPTNQAMVGFTWDFGTPPAPAEIAVTWNGWIDERPTLPLRVFFGTQSEKGEINKRLKTYRWRNQDRLPRPAPLARVPQWEQPQAVSIPVGGILWLAGGLAFYVFLKLKHYKLPGGALPYVTVWLLGAVLMSQLLVIRMASGGGSPAITEVDQAQRIVSPLLRNVYRAFDHRSESEVYDVLERSVDGELLRRLYLETMQALTLEGREGTRVSITEFQVTVDKVAANPSGDGFVAECNWMARGNVGHWGHMHSRVNIYNARLTLVPVKDEWKLSGLEVQEVRRL